MSGAVADRVAVHARVEGQEDAPALVMSSSLGTTLEMWDPQVERLAASRRLVRYDHRGHGGSPIPPGPYSIDQLGADALALMDRLGLERAAFCGLSLGGMVGMWVASEAPERIESLVLCCTTAHFHDPTPWRERIAAVKGGGTEVVADQVIERWFTAEFRAREPGRIAWVREMISSTDDGGYVACCASLERLDLRDRLGAIEAPTLVIAGAADQATPIEHAWALEREIRDARLLVLPATAHLASVARPTEVGNAIAAHLEAGSR
jgi:3-oxoadipate enol-lactonase